MQRHKNRRLESVTLLLHELSILSDDEAQFCAGENEQAGTPISDEVQWLVVALQQQPAIIMCFPACIIPVHYFQTHRAYEKGLDVSELPSAPVSLEYVLVKTAVCSLCVLSTTFVSETRFGGTPSEIDVGVFSHLLMLKTRVHESLSRQICMGRPDV